MYAFKTLVIMFTSVIFQCLREGRNNLNVFLVMNAINIIVIDVIQVMWPLTSDYTCYMSCLDYV